ncbi:class E sortase [Streptomyces sp. YIM 98790]|uniref:class E sortase n=1 Tax=Streptomyces sp. YIM 98790 TaxID=2689077 RepID=UPI0028BE8218|nr:class E sortase [Streptomyces sp. YIM 98790]
MTPQRPEETGAAAWGSGEDPYAAPGAFEAAIQSMDDPLNDPLPEYRPPGRDGQSYDPPPISDGAAYREYSYEAGPPEEPGPATELLTPVGRAATAPEPQPQPEPEPAAGGSTAGPAAASLLSSYTDFEDEYDPETIGLRRPDDLARRSAGAAGAAASSASSASSASRSGSSAPASPVPGGRVARRKAEKARKSTRMNKIANVVGELMMTFGVLLMLFVAYQLWWTNVQARAFASKEADSLAEQWEDSARNGGQEGDSEDQQPAAFSPGEGFALLHLPTLDVRVPIAEGIDPEGVLDRGMVGHYGEEDGLPTAMPWDEEGNVGLAGHRNTKGEPFRYINKMQPGDPIIIETKDVYYIYEMRSRLDQTSPRNIQVLDPIPTQGGFTAPGRYVTLTTCTPEFTSTYRLIVWGELVEEHPRSEGEPDALVN